MTHPDPLTRAVQAALDMAAAAAESAESCGHCEDIFLAATAIRAIDPAEVLAKVGDGWQTSAARDVLVERECQMTVEGWTCDRDDVYTDGEIARAAGCYAWVAAQSDNLRTVFITPPPTWPPSWDAAWWKPTDRRRDLVKAGALILAEIERLDRATPPQEAPNERT